MPRSTSSRRARRFAFAAVAVLSVAVVGVACSSGAGSSVRAKALASITNGTWDCGASKGKDSMQIEAGKDGSFEIRPLGKDKGEKPAIGSWKVVDKKVSLSIGTKGDKELLDVRGFDDLKAKAGTITVQDPENAENQATFEVDVKGTDTVAITPTADSAKEFPSGRWTCERQ